MDDPSRVKNFFFWSGSNRNWSGGEPLTYLLTLSYTTEHKWRAKKKQPSLVSRLPAKCSWMQLGTTTVSCTHCQPGNEARLFFFALHLCCVDKGCVQLTVVAPSCIPEDVFPLTPEQEADMRKIGVIDLKCGGYHFTCQVFLIWYKINLCMIYFSFGCTQPYLKNLSRRFSFASFGGDVKPSVWGILTMSLSVIGDFLLTG